MSRLCNWFGHKPSKGYAGRPQYARIVGGTVDGIRVQHCKIMVECGRCGNDYCVAMLHMPADFDVRTKRTS